MAAKPELLLEERTRQFVASFSGSLPLSDLGLVVQLLNFPRELQEFKERYSAAIVRVKNQLGSASLWTAEDLMRVAITSRNTGDAIVALLSWSNERNAASLLDSSIAGHLAKEKEDVYLSAHVQAGPGGESTSGPT